MNNNNKSSLLKPKVVIIPPSSSSISSSTSSFSLEKKPLISQRNAQLRAKFFGLIPNNEEIIYADEDDLLIFSNGTNNLGRREKHPIRSTQINTPSHPSPSSQQKHQNNSFNHNKFSLNKNKEKWKQFNSLLDCQKCNNCWNRAKAVVHDYISGAVSSVGQNLNKFRHRRNKYWSTSEGTTSSDEEKETKEQIKDTCYCVKKDCGFLYTSSRKTNKETRMEHGPREYLSCKDIGVDFCARTSSHGIPFVGTHSFFGRPFWATVTAIAFCSFIIQTYYTLSDYLEYRTIIEMQLKFEPAPFPAATICNLNAFKLSEVRKYEEIEQGIQLWERAISTLDRFKPTEATPESSKINTRKRRQQAVYRPILARCVCTNYDDQCVPQQYFPDEHNKNSSVCLCYEDQQTGDIWPCYAHFVWKQKHCSFCSHSNTCDDPDLPNNKTNNIKLIPPSIPCLCQPISHYCIKDNRKLGQDFEWWNPHNYTIYPSTTRSPPSQMEEAFGLEDLKDRGAITTRTKENLIFLVAGMSRQIRQSLSYTLHEFVLRCSFNSKDCDLNRDFQIQIDPEYGNCWTFNFNDSVELKNSRAGPMYGLRLLLNVNQSDYMPTTEAAGVRIVVHEQDQEPFPDTFGYSAPTGFVSSFGLKTKILHRLDAPYGKCSDTFRPAGYIYAEHYSPEGCYRNCFQHIILERCGCGDPRKPFYFYFSNEIYLKFSCFPLPNESEDRPCDARNPKERACLSNQTAVLGGFHHLTHDCHCVQPCTENTFETAYSAASWPAQNFNIGQDDCALVLGNNFTMASCTEYYRKNTAYIEIYYEQLNYEKLKETPGYTLVNLFSDLGGNIGLWIGFSLITVLEIVELVFECFAYGCKQCIYRPLQRKAQIRRNRRLSSNEVNLNGEIEQKEGFRHAGAKISRHISLLEPGYRQEGPAHGGHSRQYQRRWAGTARSWKRPLTQHPTNIPPFFEQKFVEVEKEKTKENGSGIHDSYNYTYTFENPFEKKGGTTLMTAPSNGTHFPSLL